MAKYCDFCDLEFPHFHAEMHNHYGELVQVVVHLFPDEDPNAEVRDPETGDVIFPANKVPLRIVGGTDGGL